MKIEIKDDEELKSTTHALRVAIIYVNDKLSSGVTRPHSERRPTAWWDNFKSDIDVAKTLRALLDKLESKEGSEQPAATATGA